MFFPRLPNSYGVPVLKNPFSNPNQQRPILRPLAADVGLLRRTRAQIEQFPAPAGPATAMVAIGTVIIIVSAALIFWADPQSETANSDLIDRSVVEEAAVEPVTEPFDTVAAPATLAAVDANRRTSPAGEPAADAAGGTIAAMDAGTGPETTAAEPAAGWNAARWVLADEPASSTSQVAVAETVEELLALEAIQEREVEADLGTPSEEITAAIDPVSKTAAKATTWVNLRAGPSDDAEVLMVVPGLAPIEAESGCNWCAVSYDGREGYIYKNFISYE